VAHQKGTAHEWTSEEAREAGRKGGLIRSANERLRKEAEAMEQEEFKERLRAQIYLFHA